MQRNPAPEASDPIIQAYVEQHLPQGQPNAPFYQPVTFAQPAQPLDNPWITPYPQSPPRELQQNRQTGRQMSMAPETYIVAPQGPPHRLPQSSTPQPPVSRDGDAQGSGPNSNSQPVSDAQPRPHRLGESSQGGLQTITAPTPPEASQQASLGSQPQGSHPEPNSGARRQAPIRQGPQSEHLCGWDAYPCADRSSAEASTSQAPSGGGKGSSSSRKGEGNNGKATAMPAGRQEAAKGLGSSLPSRPPRRPSSGRYAKIALSPSWTLATAQRHFLSM